MGIYLEEKNTLLRSTRKGEILNRKNIFRGEIIMMKEILSNETMLKEENIDKGGNTLNGNVFKGRKYCATRHSKRGNVLMNG